MCFPIFYIIFTKGFLLCFFFHQIPQKRPLLPVLNRFLLLLFLYANAYDMTGPVEILQLRHSPDKENNFFTLFENNISGVYYASFSPLEEVSDLIPIDYTSLQSMTRLHSHEYYEFMFLIDGEIYQNIEQFQALLSGGRLLPGRPSRSPRRRIRNSMQSFIFQDQPVFYAADPDFSPLLSF